MSISTPISVWIIESLYGPFVSLKPDSHWCDDPDDATWFAEESHAKEFIRSCRPALMDYEDKSPLVADRYISHRSDDVDPECWWVVENNAGFVGPCPEKEGSVGYVSRPDGAFLFVREEDAQGVADFLSHNLSSSYSIIPIVEVPVNQTKEAQP